MKPDGIWRLSPAYDLTFSVDLAAPPYINHHSLTVNGKNDNITRTDLETVALNNDIQDYKALIDNVINAINKFGSYARELEIDRQLIKNMRLAFTII